MHETEAIQVVPQMTDRVVTEGFAIGEIDEAQIPALEEQGIIFQTVPEEAPAPARATEESERVMTAVATPEAVVAGGGIELVTAGFEFGLEEAQQPLSNINTYYVTLVGPLMAQWRTQLE